MSQVPQQNSVALEMYEAAARTRENPRDYLGMSEIGKHCDRALWYSFRGFTGAPLDGRLIMLFDLGDQVERRVVHWLRLAGYEVDGQQDAFEAHGGLFRGHCDGVVHGVTQRPHILEIKSANSRRFKAFQEAGVQATEPTYYCQMQCYMGYAGLERALFVVMCKDNSELYTERVYFDRQAFQALHDRAGWIIAAGEPPERAFAQDSRDCSWCDHATLCWSPENAIQTRQTCGTCQWLRMEGVEPHCAHPGHAARLERWGGTCDDWGYLFRPEAEHDEVPF